MDGWIYMPAAEHCEPLLNRRCVGDCPSPLLETALFGGSGADTTGFLAAGTRDRSPQTIKRRISQAGRLAALPALWHGFRCYCVTRLTSR